MLLTLVRHGEAEVALDGNDTKRSLTQRGHAQADQTALFFKQCIESSLVLPDLFVVSPLVRAQQTLAYIQTLFPNITTLICDKVKPEDDAKDAIEWLGQLPFEHIVVVCHMNVVAHIAEQLTYDKYDPFSLAEARVYEQSVIANGLSTQRKAFTPNI